jgi:hypothetical protein
MEANKRFTQMQKYRYLTGRVADGGMALVENGPKMDAKTVGAVGYRTVFLDAPGATV